MATLSTAQLQLSSSVGATHRLGRRLSAASASTSSSSSSASSSSGPSSSAISTDGFDKRSWSRGILQARCQESAQRSFGFFEESLRQEGRSSSHVVCARKQSKKSANGGLAQAVEKVKILEQESTPENIYMGKKLGGYEPDFWEGEKWGLFGFIMQYLWAFGILISLVACAVAVASYNSGAVDIRNTSVFKDALENPVEIDSSLESGGDGSPFE